ncbi:multidrug ABC transporter ATP-binding protein [Bifidobacterium sp. wkB344]|nr:multidrug ABC transporter ATP-binding protein [Bifidobacterium sp. wkB344]
MLHLDHVSKSFRNKRVINDLSLSIGTGVHGLLAPNGAGKTTLIQMIATLICPDSGSITWNGQDIMVMDEDYRGLLGYLPQKFGYYPDYSAEDFLTYIAALQGIGRKRAKPLVKDLLETVGLKNQGKQKMKTLSGGMIQRVGLAQAMINDPELMILDEPTAGLDPGERVRFRNLVHALSRDRIVILSTHIVSDLETIADRVIMLKDGQICCNQSPRQISRWLEGKIFLVPADYRLGQGQLLLEDELDGDATRLRIYSPESPSQGQAVPANLEDAFLVIYGDEE